MTLRKDRGNFGFREDGEKVGEMGHYWNELGKVKAANLAQFVQDQDALNRAVEDLTSSRELLRQLEAAELFGGQTDGSIAEVAKGLGAHLQELETAAGKVVSADALAQEAIQAAQGNYDGLPDSTEPNVFEYFAATNPIVQVGSYIMTGQEFLASVTAAREAERERQAKEALDALKVSLDRHQEVISGIDVRPIEFAFVDANSDGVSGPVSPGDPIAPVPPRGSAPPGGPVPP
ncbi:MAG: hypothetical protein Q4E05_10695, partial [Pseudoclavibacter sp.]|nr:hypothetical protein [Pseudoclavibacter sp.]